MDRSCSKEVRNQKYKQVWWENLRERVHLQAPGIYEWIIIRWIYMKWDMGIWTGSSWLRIETGGGHL